MFDQGRITDVDFYGESQFKYAMSFICLIGTVFLHNFRAELMMGLKFSVFVFVLCLYGVMVSQARVPPNHGLHDIKKSPKNRRSIENLRPPLSWSPRPAADRRTFRENDVKFGDT